MSLLIRCACIALGFGYCFYPVSAQETIIIDHTCTDIDQIPSYWLEQAKQLAIHYGHTSHGSQLISGAELLEGLHPEYGVHVFYAESAPPPALPPECSADALCVYDGNPPETYIEPDDYWQSVDGGNRTRAVADTGLFDYSMWSWCGQVSYYSTSEIQEYLDTLSLFESEYPAMRFVYMTGHLDGTGSGGVLHQNNQMIRQYCINNHKVLFDFADIERFDPDGVDYLDLGADDGCNYYGGNWAQQWCDAHPGHELCIYCYCEHSEPLNCNLKARAFWWMMARLAGWPGPVPVTPTPGVPIPATDTTALGILIVTISALIASRSLKNS